MKGDGSWDTEWVGAGGWEKNTTGKGGRIRESGIESCKNGQSGGGSEVDVKVEIKKARERVELESGGSGPIRRWS